MASSGNTWFKKLKAKQRKYAMRFTKKRRSVDAEPLNGNTVVKVREYLAPVDLNFVPRKPRGSSGCRLSHEKRLLILQKYEKRAAFFAELGVRV
jgi:hypothetical protein